MQYLSPIVCTVCFGIGLLRARALLAATTMALRAQSNCKLILKFQERARELGSEPEVQPTPA